MLDLTGPQATAPWQSTVQSRGSVQFRFRSWQKQSPPQPQVSREAADRFCPFCGTGLSREFDFCPKCGKAVPRVG